MLGGLFLSDSRRHPVQFPACAFDLVLRLFLAPAVHLRQSFGQPPAGATQDGNRYLQVAFQSRRHRPGGWRRPLRLQKQFRLGQDAFADHARAVPPGGIKLSGLPRVATVLDECGRHPHALFQVDARHRHQILHRQCRTQLSFSHLLLDGFR
jgi:hypothetical protein